MADENIGPAFIAIACRRLRGCHDVGEQDGDTECVNGPRGNAADHLTKEVRPYVISQFGTSSDPANWGVVGWSSGGTCAIDLAVVHPDLFNTFEDIGGDRGPNSGTKQQTIDRLYGGDAAAWDAYDPRTVMARHGPYAGVAGYFDDSQEPPDDDVHGGPDAGGWTEFVTRSAFDRTLSEKPYVHLLINHEGLPLASTKSGTLRLSTDSQGLQTEADLDRRDPDVASLAVKMERGDVDEMSFAFRVRRQRWAGNNDELRYLDEVSLHKGDVSIVSFGANPHTSAALRSAIKMLARGELDDRQLAELRAMPNHVKRAMAAMLIGAPRKRALSPLADLEGGDVFDQGEPRDSTLAQAIHDLCAAEDSVSCDPTNLPLDTPMYEPVSESNSRNLSLAEAAMLAGMGGIRRRGSPRRCGCAVDHPQFWLARCSAAVSEFLGWESPSCAADW